MPKLISRVDGAWLPGTVEPIAWKPVGDWKPGDPLLLHADDEPLAEHAEASMIAIDFPQFNDGRGLSTAVLLRTRFGYDGEIRAVGAVHEDILHYMVRCGFTTFELLDERDADTAIRLIEPYSDQYQSSVIEPEPQFKRLQRGT